VYEIESMRERREGERDCVCVRERRLEAEGWRGRVGELAVYACMRERRATGEKGDERERDR